MPDAPLVTPPPSWAEVRAGEHVVRYRRTGEGRPLLLLSPPRGATPLWPGLRGALERRFRVVEPDLPADGELLVPLTAFVEGLGLTGMVLIAAGDHCPAAVDLALSDPERLVAVLLGPEPRGGGPSLDALLAGAAALLSVPTGVVPLDEPGAEALRALTGLLSRVAGAAEG